MGNDSGKRKLPTRAGWWWIEADPEITRDEKPMQVVQVTQGCGGLLVSGTMPNRVDQRPDIVWLAPIPGPAVLAALAEYGAAFMARDDDARAGGAYANGEVRRERIADGALHDAIRAERDGAA